MTSATPCFPRIAQGCRRQARIKTRKAQELVPPGCYGRQRSQCQVPMLSALAGVMRTHLPWNLKESARARSGSAVGRPASPSPERTTSCSGRTGSRTPRPCRTRRISAQGRGEPGPDDAGLGRRSGGGRLDPRAIYPQAPAYVALVVPALAVLALIVIVAHLLQRGEGRNASHSMRAPGNTRVLSSWGYPLGERALAWASAPPPPAAPSTAPRC